MPSFTCSRCREPFSVPQPALDKYPGWTPRTCRPCKDGPPPDATAKAPRRRGGSATATRDLRVAEVLERYHEGPTDGIFTDGSAMPNPGPGGWGAVHVRGNEVVEQRHGHDPDTTNNRMELTALIAGLEMAPADEEVVLYTDSELVKNIATTWAASWERAGWKRRTGPIANLDLVQRLHAVVKQRPRARIAWAPAHSGWRWNEYADALASAHRRSEM